MKVQFVGIITRHDTPEVKHIGEELALWLRQHNIDAELNIIRRNMDMLVVLGGDGTLLHVATQASEYDIPVLGVNLGNLGFLTEVAADELYHTLETVLSGDIRIENRMMLSTAYINGETGKKSKPVFALNEVVIVKASTQRIVRLCCWADREYITTYKADGLIMATPTGSTAYNLSAGGPIVHAELNTIVVTPICPFMLDARPVLLAPETKITTQLLAPAGDVKVIIDGNQHWKISENDYLLVERATKPLQLISSPVKSYFTILRNKLNWGGAAVDLPLPEQVCKYC